MKIDLTELLKRQAELDEAYELAKKKQELAKAENEELAQAIKTIQKYTNNPSVGVLTARVPSENSVSLTEDAAIESTKTMREQILEGFKATDSMTIKEVVGILGLDKTKYASVNTTLHAMVRQAKLEKVSPGKFRKI